MSALAHFIGTDPRTVVHISECEGCTIIEPMRFLSLREARQLSKQRRSVLPNSGAGAGDEAPSIPRPTPSNDDPPNPPEAA